MRGDVYRLRATRAAQGHEQRGPRYAVIVQSDHLRLSTVLVAPTSTSAKPTAFRPRIELNGVVSYVLIEQTSAIDVVARLGDFAGRLSASEMAEIDRALAITMGLF